MENKINSKGLFSILSYLIFGIWIALTVLPLFWMGYSSFKSNEELTRNIYAFPRDLIENKDDVYEVIQPGINTIVPGSVKRRGGDHLVIESTTISPGREIMVHYLPMTELTGSLSYLQPGDRISVREFPKNLQRQIQGSTIWFNFIAAFVRGDLGTKFVNSLIYTGVSTFAIIALSLMTGFALSKFPFRRVSAIIAAVIGFGYLLSTNSVLIPLFLMLSKLGLTNSRPGIILVYTAFGLPMSIMLSTQFMRGLPASLIESAEIDGAGIFRVFLSIIMPMALPVMVTIGILNALMIWNEFLLVLVMSTTEATRSLPVGVYSFSSATNVQLGWQMAALVIATVPTILVYFLFNKRLAEGVVAGAVKG